MVRRPGRRQSLPQADRRIGANRPARPRPQLEPQLGHVLVIPVSVRRSAVVLQFRGQGDWRRPFNPVYAVRLAAEVTPEAASWPPAEAARFLSFTADDPLHLLFRIVVLCGARRSEACGFGWAGADLDAGCLAVERTLHLLGAKLHWETPKTKGSRRLVWLDSETAGLLREHRKAQVAARLRAGSAWEDNDLVFSREDGTPYRPDYVLRRFKRLAADAGVPVIKLHEGRHTAASLSDEAEVSQEIRQRTLGHASAGMTSHYTHVRAERHRAAAEQVAALVAKAGTS